MIEKESCALWFVSSGSVACWHETERTKIVLADEYHFSVCDWTELVFVFFYLQCLPCNAARSQVVRILDMFYQPWLRVFVDVRGAEYDVMKPKFADSRRLFRFLVVQYFFDNAVTVRTDAGRLWK